MGKLVLFSVISAVMLAGLSCVSATGYFDNPFIINNAKPDSEAGGLSGQKIDISIYVLNLGKFDISTGGFTADFYLLLKCPESCNSSNFEFMNGRASSFEKIIDGEREKFYRIQANLNSQVDLKRFPFDSQTMEIIIEDKAATIDEIVYRANREESGIDNGVVFTGWNIDGWESEVNEHYYPPYDERYSQYIFSIHISRIYFNSFLKTFLPVIFIVLVTLFSYVIDPDKISQRLGVAGSSLVAAVMFHVAITNQIPPVGYLTFADKFMMLTYFVLLATFFLNILMLELQELKKLDLVEKIHRRTEYSIPVIVPLLYAGLFLIFL